MVPMTARRPGSSWPTTPYSIPTPKSKPSSRQNPTHSTVRTRNQKATRVMEPSAVGPGPLRCFGSVARFQLRRLLAGLGGGLVGPLPPGEARHQTPVDDGEHPVERDEDDQAHHHGGRADRR